MSRESLTVLLGAVVLFMPVIGVPAEWKFYATIAIGSILIITGLSLRRSAYRRKIDRGGGERGTDSFVESSPEEFEEVTLYSEGEIEIDDSNLTADRL